MWSGAAPSLCRERFYLGPVLGHCLLPAFSHVLVGEEARLDVTFQLLIFFLVVLGVMKKKCLTRRSLAVRRYILGSLWAVLQLLVPASPEG